GGKVSEDIGGGTTGVDRVLTHIEDSAVERHLDEVFLSLHHHLFQAGRLGAKLDSAEVSGWSVRLQDDPVKHLRGVAYKVDHSIVSACGGFKAERTRFGGDAPRDERAVGRVVKAYSSVREGLPGFGVDYLSRNGVLTAGNSAEHRERQ